MGLEPADFRKGKPSESSLLNAISKFAIDSQLQKDVLSDPRILNRPTWKPWLQFKSFGYRQYNFIKNQLSHDVAHHNYMPLLRLAGAGFATGLVSLKAKELMKYLVSGEKTYDPSNFLQDADVKDIIENVAAIGAFGFTGDFMSAALEEGRSYSRALSFFATPVLMDDIDMFLNEFLPAIESDYQKYQGDFVDRVPARILKYSGSPLLKDFSKRLETPGLKQQRIVRLRGRFKSKLLDSIIKADTVEAYQEAIVDARQWNDAYPQYRITLQDIDHKAVIKRKMKKWKNRNAV